MSRVKQLDVKAIIERAKVALEVHTDVELSKLLEIKQQTISAWRRRNNIDLDKIITTCRFVSMDWLLYGEGNMNGGPEADDVTQKMLLILEDMDMEQKREILRHIQEKELLTELLNERKAS